MFGGFAGAFFAARQGFISPESFVFLESAQILAIVVLGGVGSLLGVVVAGTLSHFVIDNDFDLSGARGVRASIALILLPGIVSLNPRVHAAQAVLLCVAIAIAASYVSRPIG